MAQKRIPQKVVRAISEYLDVLKKDKLPIVRVYLYGSYAKGTPHQWSDIDLCIISPQFKDPWKALHYLWSKRVHDEGLTIEPIGFSQKDFQDETTLISEIKRTGIEISLN